jgi:hypothetical protein
MGDRVSARRLLPSGHDVALASPPSSPRRRSNLRRRDRHCAGQQSPRTPRGNVEWCYLRPAQQRQPGRSHRDRRERPRDRRKLEAQRHMPWPSDAQQHLKRLPPLPPQARAWSDLRRRRRRLPQTGRREPVRRGHLPPGQRTRFERNTASRSSWLTPASGRRSLQRVATCEDRRLGQCSAMHLEQVTNEA